MRFHIWAKMLATGPDANAFEGPTSPIHGSGLLGQFLSFRKAGLREHKVEMSMELGDGGLCGTEGAGRPRGSRLGCTWLLSGVLSRSHDPKK